MFDWFNLCPAPPQVREGPNDISSLDPSFDQYNVYIDRAELQARKSKGLESFAYKIFGSTFMGSWAFALDPYRPFHFPRYKVSPVTRTRSFIAIPRKPRFIHSYSKNVYMDDEDSGTDMSYSGAALPAQERILGYRADTTRRSRPMGSDQGEFELFKPSFDCPPRSRSWLSGYVLTTLSPPQPPAQLVHHEGTTFKGGYTLGPGFTVGNTAVQAIRTAESAASSSLFSKYGIGLLQSCRPGARKLNLLYSLTELRELPGTLREDLKRLMSIPKTIRNPSPLALKLDKALSDAYLEYQFAWKALINDINNMLKIPQKIANQVNLLIERQGLDQTFRAVRYGSGSVTGVLSFGCETFASETPIRREGPYSNRWQIRATVNCNIDFPRVDVPRLRNDLTVRLFGLDASPEDIYNIIPWTWLIDWFSGLGDYVAMMNYIHSDRSLVNWALLTYVSEGTANLTFTTRVTTTKSYSHDGNGYQESFSQNSAFSAAFKWKYVKRISASSLGSLRGRDSTKLSSGQQSILTALSSKYGKR